MIYDLKMFSIFINKEIKIMESDEPSMLNDDSIPDLIEYEYTIFMRRRNNLRRNTRILINTELQPAPIENEQETYSINLFYSLLSDVYSDHYVESQINHLFEESQENALPKTDRIINIEKYLNKDETPTEVCSICLEKIVTNEEISTLSCRHFFHYNCILEWGKRKASCPTCRENIM